MVSSRWQKQHIHFRSIVWGTSAVVSLLVILILLSLGYRIEVAGVFFILVFVILRVTLAYIFNNRLGNSLVRILKFDYEAIERDFRILFKNNNVSFKRTTAEDEYRYEFPWHRLSMIVQPYWISPDSQQPLTKVTLRVLNAKNKTFAASLAEAIDEMAIQLAAKQEEA